MCGMGRTGTLHACEQEGVAPDLMAIAKGLGGGYQPIGAVLAQRRDRRRDGAGSGFFQHGHTYLGHPVACAAALAVQQRDRARRAARAACARAGARSRRGSRERFGDHPHVGDIRGRGLFCGDRAGRATARRKAPFDPALQLHARVKREAMDRGLMMLSDGRDDRRRARATTCCSRRRSSSSEDASRRASSTGWTRRSTPRSHRSRA